MRLFLAASSSANRSNPSPTTEQLTNCYAYPAPEGSLAPFVIRSTPGLRGFASLPGPFLRAMARVGDMLYVVTAGGLHRVNSDGTATQLATVNDDIDTSIVGNRDNVTFTAGGAYYLWNGTALTQPTGGAFDSMGSVAFLDQYTLLSELDGRRFQWSEPGLPASLNGLFFATAEARDDKVLRVVDTMGYLAILKALSVELWATVGAAERAFGRVDGSVLDRGLKAYNLMTKTPDGVFYIANDNTARMATAGGSATISPPHVVENIKNGTPTHCFYFEDRGQQFHVIRYGDRPADVYDAATGFWHRRSSGVEHKPWDIIAAAECYGQWHLGHREGRIYRLGAQPHDDGAPLRRTIVTRPLYNDDDPFSISELQLLGLFGNYSIEETAPNWITDQNGLPILDQNDQFILASEQGAVTTTKRPGRIWARFSRNGGFSWGTPKLRNIGKAGERGVMVKWRTLGQFKHFTAEFNITDPVDVPLLSEAVVTTS